MSFQKLFPAAVFAASAALAGCSNEPENDGSLRGTLAVSVAAMRDGTSQRVFQLVANDREGDDRRLVFAEEPDLAPGSEIKVWGELDGNDLVVRRFDVIDEDARSGTARVVEPLIDAPPDPDRSVGVVLVSFDGMATNYPPSRATTDYFGEGSTDRSLKRWFGEASYGVQDITGGVVSLTQAYSSCSTSPGSTTRNWVSDVDRALGFTPHHYVWVLLDTSFSSCGFYSLLDVGSPSNPARNQWIYGAAELNSPTLGCALRTHGPLINVGHQPSSALDCGSEIFANDPQSCTQTQFRDPEDPLSAADCRHLSAVGKQYEGWFGGCNSVRVNESGDFTLLPTEIECNGIQVLQVPMPTVGLPEGGRFVTKESGREAVGFYYLELRTNTGFDSGSGRTPRVVVRIANDYPRPGSVPPRTFILDMNPTTTVSDGMTQGQTFTDPAGGVSFTVQTLSNTSATVTVTVPTSAPNTCAGGGTIAAPGPATCTSAAGGMGGVGGMGGAGGANGGAGGAGAGAGGSAGMGGASAGGVAGSGSGGAPPGGMGGVAGTISSGAGGMSRGGAGGGGRTGSAGTDSGGAGGEDGGGAGAGGDAGEGGVSTGGSAGAAGARAGAPSGGAGNSAGGAGRGGTATAGTTSSGGSNHGGTDDDADSSGEDTGCGCRIENAAPRRDSALVLGLLAVLAGARRRRRH